MLKKMRKRVVRIRRLRRRWDFVKKVYVDDPQEITVNVYGRTRKELRDEQARKQKLYERGLLR